MTGADPATGPRSAVRPTVSVIVPFAGDAADAAVTLTGLQALDRHAGDEIIVVDNTASGVIGAAPPGITVIHAARWPSSYYARNVGAEHSSGEWLLFVDADCRPAPELLDAYLREPIEPSVGCVAGSVRPLPGARGPIARYAGRRDWDKQRVNMEYAPRPLFVTANALVRRRAWEEIGGFAEGIRSGGDVDLSWRMQDAGWTLAFNPYAVVHHRQRETLRALIRQHVRYGAGRRWLAAHHTAPGVRPPLLHTIGRPVVGAVRWTLLGQPQRALDRALDAVVGLSTAVGLLLGNGPPALPARRPDLVVAVDRFPSTTESFIIDEVRALCAAGLEVRVEALVRGFSHDRAPLRELDVRFMTDDSVMRRVRDLAWLTAQHPFACIRDLAARPRWRVDEDVMPLRTLAPMARRLAASAHTRLHVHFAALAALQVLRVSRLIERRYAMTVHAFDIFQTPRNLEEKLAGASAILTVSDYNARHLRRTWPALDGRVHSIGMGVDTAWFRRRRPLPSSRRVVAVGRLVEKKGFRHLVEAAALLGTDVDEVVIAGDGPLRAELRDQIAELGLEAVVHLAGARSRSEVRDLLEDAVVFAAPCVIASDGDRDGLPVVVLEAMAMEVPVVASDAVGLPEVVRPEWGRVVAATDTQALAEALRGMLALPPTHRSAMGRAGRRWVTEHRELRTTAARTWSVVDGASA